MFRKLAIESELFWDSMDAIVTELLQFVLFDESHFSTHAHASKIIKRSRFVRGYKSQLRTWSNVYAETHK